MLSARHEIQSLVRFLFDASASVSELDASDRVSPFLLGSFDLYETHALGETFVIAASRSHKTGINALASQIAQLSHMLGTVVLPFLPGLRAADRRSLIERRMGFLCESGDAYLPLLGLHLRSGSYESSWSRRAFTPADQSTFIFGLYADRFTSADVIQSTGLSAGSVSRALQNMMRARMLDFTIGGKTGRRKEYFKPDARDYYTEGRRLFGRAVASVMYTDQRPDPDSAPFFVSGLSALGARSNLVGPDREVWATHKDNAFLVSASADVPSDHCRYMVQLLAYDPAPFAASGVVDAFTMLATISEEDIASDERVRMAVREAMGDCAWYQD